MKLKYLFDQVVDNVPVIPGEPGNKTGNVPAALERESCQLQRCYPPLRTLPQRLDVYGGKIQSCYVIEVGGSLLRCKAQLRCTELDKFAAHPPTGQRQLGVSARADHNVDVGRKVVKQEDQPVGDLVAVNEVVVIEHQPDISRRRRQIVQHHGEHGLGRDV
ncbi:hypothetical protein [Arthrobacter sp. UYEF36]|uniref:hypothetical protein n=1 Tax=Arthrobacter sp. UYEF36 TaxID=1756366 RepID=UPI003393DAC4